MGKRSDFERKPRDYYPTPYAGVLPLLSHLPNKSSFVEPCAGDGRMVRHLQKHAHECVYACDIEPQNDPTQPLFIDKQDVLFFNHELPEADYIITNPPWDREILHPMIEAFRLQAPTWLLFDSDWWYTKQANPLKPFCHKLVPVGRLSWEGNGVSGQDNCSWYLFDRTEAPTIAY